MASGCSLRLIEDFAEARKRHGMGLLPSNTFYYPNHESFQSVHVKCYYSLSLFLPRKIPSGNDVAQWDKCNVLKSMQLVEFILQLEALQNVAIRTEVQNSIT